MFSKLSSLERTFQYLSHGILDFSVAQKLVDFLIFTCLGIFCDYLDLKICERWKLMSAKFKDQINLL